MNKVCLVCVWVCLCCSFSFTQKDINDDCEKSTAKDNQNHFEFVAYKLVLPWDKTKTEGEFISLDSM